MMRVMRKVLLSLLFITGVVNISYAQAPMGQIKTRLDLLSGTPYVVVISTLPSEITSITCDSWIMLGVNSYKHHNDFTIPGTNHGVAIAVMNADKFDGYCKGPDSIKAHTDDGDFTGYLDRGAGNWNASTKLTFSLPTTR